MAGYTYTDVDKNDSAVPDSTLRVSVDPKDGVVLQITEMDDVLVVRMSAPVVRDLVAALTDAVDAIEAADRL